MGAIFFFLQGLCQLFDLYFFSIYKMFGQREAFSGSQGQSNSYCKFVDLNYFSPFFNLILVILLRVYEGKFPFRLKILCYLLSWWYYLSCVENWNELSDMCGGIMALYVTHSFLRSNSPQGTSEKVFHLSCKWLCCVSCGNSEKCWAPGFERPC